jgi:ATPase components of ABC transporters with duplicated ATPase domains
MIVLSCKNISKSYGINTILKDITFSINEGDKVGIIGSNGEGKTTLFKILSKEITQDDGEIFIDRNKSLGYLAQHLALESTNTIYDEMLLVFEDLINLEKKILDLEIKMNEPYDENNAAYHEKIIKDYGTAQDLYQNRGGYTYKGEISRIIKGLGFVEEDFNKLISTLSGGKKLELLFVSFYF